MPVTGQPPPPPPPDFWDDWIRVAQSMQLEWAGVPSSATLGRFVKPSGESVYLCMSAIAGRMVAIFSTTESDELIELLITKADAAIVTGCEQYQGGATDVTYDGKDYAFYPALDGVPVVRSRET